MPICPCLDQILDFVANIVTIAGVVCLFFAWNEYKRNNELVAEERKKDKISQLKTLLDGTMLNEHVLKFMYILDYKGEWYNEQFHHSDNEADVDLALSAISYIAYLLNNGYMERKDLEFTQWTFDRIIKNIGTQNYLYNLYHIAKFTKERERDFVYYEIIRYWELNVDNENQILNKTQLDEFRDKESCKKENHYFTDVVITKKIKKK